MDLFPVPKFGYLSYTSLALNREMSCGYFAPALPDSIASSERIAGGRRYPLLVMLHGLGGSYMDWPQHTNIARTLAGYDMVVAFPDGGDGWYTNAVDGAGRHEDHLIDDFLPFLQQSLPILPAGPSWAISGLSMGGYGAVKMALKYPHLFSAAISHSGAINGTSCPHPHPVFGDPETDTKARKQQNLYWLAEQALCRYPAERPQLYLDCGASDSHLGENRQFSDHLQYIGYGHEFRELPGHHSWPYWNRAFRTILPTIARELGAQRRADRF